MAMAKVCKRCGKIDQSVNTAGYCKGCYDQEKADYELVRSYVRLHPNVTVYVTHKATGVSLKAIARMVQEGGLTLKENEESEE